MPSLPQDEEKMDSFKNGDIVQAEIKKPRNIRHHRKFFALVNFVMQNQEQYKNQEDLLVEIKLKTGHYQEHITTKGKLIYVPKSISFSKMDEHEFNLFYSKAIDVCIANFMTGMTPEEVNRQVDNILIGWA